MVENHEAHNGASTEALPIITPELKLRVLLHSMGERITAVAVGTGDAAVLRAWDESPERLPEEAADRVNLLFDTAAAVALMYDAETARAFLRGTSEYLGDQSPLLVIRETDSITEARQLMHGALHAFLD